MSNSSTSPRDQEWLVISILVLNRGFRLNFSLDRYLDGTKKKFGRLILYYSARGHCTVEGTVCGSNVIAKS